MSSSNFDLTEDASACAVFHCDGKKVTVEFYVDDRRVGDRLVFSRPEAVETGQRILESGVYSDFPIRLSPDCVKHFGARLRTYGETGR